MKFSDIENIWSADLSTLSNVDRGRVYFERAKQVVHEVLADPDKHQRALRGKRFRRSYLIEQIGCQPAVTRQNPKIRKLLADTDWRLGRLQHQSADCDRHLSGTDSGDVDELRAEIYELHQRVEAQASEITSLRRKLRRDKVSG